uniref:Transition state regulatory protein abrB HOMODIMER BIOINFORMATICS n=1 Tax=Siphoviridae sp. ctPsO101 TaxID=2825487 RepID=A0A8S5PWK2_9CAUD|nr:MAG TPA: Transition state regulatory protein abrB HOMODIMER BIOINFORMATICS [Siphoviridae sp. ctPsO101]DAJ57050.1 MAG TPA: Transition state regulatory protein abrB HOMODIMER BIOINFORMATICS [Caudoviricetes sp.]
MIKKIIINKPGGTASKNAVMYRLTIPAEMVALLGITPDDRSVELEMVGDTLTIRKIKEEK